MLKKLRELFVNLLDERKKIQDFIEKEKQAKKREKQIKAELKLLKVNDDELLLTFPLEKNQKNILNAFWQWIDILDKDDYKAAIEALYWDRDPVPPLILKKQIRELFKSDGGQPLDPVTPCQELKEKVETHIEIHWDNFVQYSPEEQGWGMFLVPVTDDRALAKQSLDALLMGVAVSFFIREYNGKFVFKFEIIHM